MQTWKGTNSLLGTIRGGKHNIYGHIKINNQPVLDHISLAKNLEEQIPHRPYVKTFEQHSQSFYLEHVISSEFNNIIGELKTSKHCFNNISA